MLFPLSPTNTTLYPVCLQDLHHDVEPVQGGRYMLLVKTPKLKTLKLKLLLTSFFYHFSSLLTLFNTTLHPSRFIQTT